ncbi:MAG: TlyA family RNA methyltransferase [Chloroflexi bacterium]|nr:MAG: TlyA family RNA methyltransferase [Chloroflexota bacterium]MBL1196578.1 TlyA family RNA methyltransferase [Chloroflexota bacterium]NOH13873.1 TlyA family RNA methyltransferase [Chloroflexota bacterium]
MPKQRIDVLLVERGLAESRNKAQRLVMAGQVRVNGQVAMKSSEQVAEDAELAVDSGPRFVSRGGGKLLAALEGFEVDVEGKICADVGASTGGFTDCLLQHGAAKVYAIDVGRGILHWKLRQDERVVVMEGTNARYIENLPEAVELVTIDASFISLKVLLPMVKDWLAESGEVIALIKPQFEAGKQEASKGKGVIKDPKVRQRVVDEISAFALEQGYIQKGLTESPVKGPKGNVEFLLWLEVISHHEL